VMRVFVPKGLSIGFGFEIYLEIGGWKFRGDDLSILVRSHLKPQSCRTLLVCDLFPEKNGGDRARISTIWRP
jgi:hypothetical protein